MLKTIGYVLNVKDVINDAHNTFIKDSGKDSEQETYMEDVMKKDKAFNWSDEEVPEVQSDSQASPATPDKLVGKIIKKPKYKQNQNTTTT